MKDPPPPQPANRDADGTILILGQSDFYGLHRYHDSYI